MLLKLEYLLAADLNDIPRHKAHRRSDTHPVDIRTQAAVVITDTNHSSPVARNGGMAARNAGIGDAQLAV